jgi:hypothetical protein
MPVRTSLPYSFHDRWLHVSQWPLLMHKSSLDKAREYRRIRTKHTTKPIIMKNTQTKPKVAPKNVRGKAAKNKTPTEVYQKGKQK